jgi:signal transduction histidine kinase
MRLPGRGVLGGAAALALVLGGLGWLDYRATVRELRAALASEAEALHAAIAAAAAVQHAAAGEAERALAQRLLEHARLLATMDRRQGLDRTALDSVAGSTDMFRVIVFEADGTRAYVGGEAGMGAGRGGGFGPREGRGPDGHGPGGAPPDGAGPPAGASRVAQRLLAGESEVVSAAHLSRGGAERVAAGVRRSGGGAIVLNAANRAARELDAVYSLDSLVTRVAAATPGIAYIIITGSGDRLARGPMADEADAAISNGSVLERTGLIPLNGDRPRELRIGMRLDEVARAERRALARIAGGLSAVGAVLVLAVAFGALRSRYGDLSERHATAQEALRRRDRLAAMGELASTVAHEIRNPLNAIAMSAQRLAREYPAEADTSGDVTELVRIIQSEASRINGKVQQFLEFARPPALNVRDVSLGDLLIGIADAARPVAAAREIRISADTGGAGTVKADPDQLRNALDNLVRNALDATPPGGTVTLRAGREGSTATIEVEDTGTGIAGDILPRVFDLYFTTKRDGTGVGLAVAQQIVAAHGGTIEVHSAIGQGTRMTINLPQVRVAHV